MIDKWHYKRQNKGILNTKKWHFQCHKNGVLNANLGILNARINYEIDPWSNLFTFLVKNTCVIAKKDYAG